MVPTSSLNLGHTGPSVPGVLLRRPWGWAPDRLGGTSASHSLTQQPRSWQPRGGRGRGDAPQDRPQLRTQGQVLITAQMAVSQGIRSRGLGLPNERVCQALVPGGGNIDQEPVAWN